MVINYTFKIENNEFLSKHNNGSFGNLYIVEYKATNEQYAVKTYTFKC